MTHLLTQPAREKPCVPRVSSDTSAPKETQSQEEMLIILYTFKSWATNIFDVLQIEMEGKVIMI